MFSSASLRTALSDSDRSLARGQSAPSTRDQRGSRSCGNAPPRELTRLAAGFGRKPWRGGAPRRQRPAPCRWKVFTVARPAREPAAPGNRRPEPTVVVRSTSRLLWLEGAHCAERAVNSARRTAGLPGASAELRGPVPAGGAASPNCAASVTEHSQLAAATVKRFGGTSSPSFSTTARCLGSSSVRSQYVPPRVSTS